jgi:hypothetical protein
MDCKRYVRVVLLAAGLLPGCGDVAFESDPCKYMVGSHTVHFETFQGSVWARKPCDEIPSIGSVSLSIDIFAKAAETNWLAIFLVAVFLAAAGYYYFMMYRKRPAVVPA